jgi:hypothetical protein
MYTSIQLKYILKTYKEHILYIAVGEVGNFLLYTVLDNWPPFIYDQVYNIYTSSDLWRRHDDMLHAPARLHDVAKFAERGVLTVFKTLWGSQRPRVYL